MNSLQTIDRQEVDSGEILAMIGRASTDPNVSVEKMERLFALQERWEKRKSEKEAHLAMIAARSEMPEVSKDTRGENSKFAKLEKIDRLAYPIYTKNGFSLQWSEAECQTPGWTRLKCVVLHSGGHREEHFLQGPMDDKGPKGAPNKTGIQGMGSTWSYLQRRLLAMIFNIRIVGDDNDGQNHDRPTRTPGTPPPKPQPDLKAAKSTLWAALKKVGPVDDIPAIENWMVQQKIIQKGQTLGTLDAAACEEATNKIEIILQERNRP